jgi:hypothetical protein
MAVRLALAAEEEACLRQCEQACAGEVPGWPPGA